MISGDRGWLYLRSWGKYWLQSLWRLKERQLVGLLLCRDARTMVSAPGSRYGGFWVRSSWSPHNALGCSGSVWASSSLCFLMILSSWKEAFLRQMSLCAARSAFLRPSCSRASLFWLRTSGCGRVSGSVWSQAPGGTQASSSFSAMWSCCCCKPASWGSSLSSHCWSGNQRHPERRSAPLSLPVWPRLTRLCLWLDLNGGRALAQVM